MTREQLDAFCKAVAAVCKEHEVEMVAGDYTITIGNVGEYPDWRFEMIGPSGVDGIRSWL